MLKASEHPLCAGYDVALLDLDGVVYIGPDAVPGAPEALSAARRAGMRTGFVTNNAARTPEVVASHLCELNVPARPSDVVTSAQAAAAEVARLVPESSAVLVVGGEGLLVALRECGLRPVAFAAENPAAVVQGFSPDLAWPALREGALALARGVPWVVSNLDLTVNVPGGIAPACGSFVEVLALTTGRRPDVVAGKPHLPLHRESIRRTGALRPLVVGDRLDTDIEGAVRGEVDSLLVLTGVTDVRGLLEAPPHCRPTYLAADLAGLLAVHPGVEHRGEGVYVCRSSTARVRRGQLETTGGSLEDLDRIRAACAAVWHVRDSAGVVDVAAAAHLLQ